MYFRGLSSDKKTKLAYSNGISQVNLPSPFSDGGNIKAYKTRWKLSIVYQQKNTHKNRGSPKKVPYQILQNSNSKTLISKEQRKLILLPGLFNKLK